MSNPLGNNGHSRDPEVRERQFWSRAEYVDGCWVWTGFIMRKGYGELKFMGKMKRAHRLAFELAHGEIPDGDVLDHLCRNRACINPSHLEPVTNKDNVLRGKGIAALNASKTHCLRGHKFAPETTYITRDNKRVCKICRTINQTNWKKKRLLG